MSTILTYKIAGRLIAFALTVRHKICLKAGAAGDEGGEGNYGPVETIPKNIY
jgi:hypothetical protein